jgi:hypothetical protein
MIVHCELAQMLTKFEIPAESTAAALCLYVQYSYASISFVWVLLKATYTLTNYLSVTWLRCHFTALAVDITLVTS